MRQASNINQLWHLIEARTKIQRCNLVLLRILKTNEKELSSNSNRSDWTLAHSILQDTVGSNLSLWRLAFLIYVDQNGASKVSAMINMLHGLIEDNSFLFPHEVAAQSWLAPYYRDNAAHRVSASRTNIEKYCSEVGLPNPLVSLVWPPFPQDRVGELDHDTDEAPDNHFVDAFNSLVTCFNAQIEILNFLKGFLPKHDLNWPRAVKGIDKIKIEAIPLKKTD